VLQKVLQKVLDVEVPNIQVCDLLALSKDLRQKIVDQTRMQNKISIVGATLVTVPKMPVEFAMPFQKIEVIVMGRYQEWKLLNEGSEIVIV